MFKMGSLILQKGQVLGDQTGTSLPMFELYEKSFGGTMMSMLPSPFRSPKIFECLEGALIPLTSNSFTKLFLAVE